jgi:hypothetical protein
MHGRIAHSRASLLAIAALALCAALPAAASAHMTGVDHIDTGVELSDTPIETELAAAQRAGVTENPFTVAADTLPTTTWCGDATTVDDTADATYPASASQFKFIYAYPADRPNRFNQWAPALQANASIIEQYVAAQPGSARAPRFDLGTVCGHQFADIQTVALPGSRASYQLNFGAVRNAVAAKLNTNPGGLRNYVVFADTLGPAGNGLRGQGELVAGSGADAAGSSNPNNAGNKVSIMWMPDGMAVPSSPSSGWWPSGVLHEMGHNIGAVQWSAPHSTHRAGTTDYTYSHCWDGADVMCYQDGPSPSHTYDPNVCAGAGGVIWATWDCNRDDYFNPSPPAGSYLDTHWNTYNSVFMGDCTGLATCTASAPVPVNSVRPAVTGSATVGRTLTATQGTWDDAASVNVRWQRCGVSCNDIAGATDVTYVVTSADVGLSLRAVAQATSAEDGTIAAFSLKTAVVPKAPANTALPAFTGVTVTGRTISTTAGSWSPAGSYTYRWQRCDSAGQSCADIAGATASQRTLTDDDLGARLTVTVTATATSGIGVATSTPTTVVRAPYTVTTPPSVSGDTVIGETLTATPAVFAPTTADVRYQWLRCTTTACAAITGATASTYTLVAADWNRRMTVRVSPFPDLAPTPTSDQTDLVAYPPLASSAPPAVTGTAEAGYTLKTTTGTWSRAVASVGIQWRRCAADGTACADITNARAATYVPQAADADGTLRVHVRGVAGFDSSVAEADSSAVAIAEAAPPQATTAPALSGTARRTMTLTGTRGTWTGNPSAYALQWRRCNDALASSCAGIAGATAATYKLAVADEGSYVSMQVTATGPGGSTTAYTPPAGPVATAPPVLVTAAALIPPAVVQQGATMKLTTGTWTGPEITYAYGWQRCTVGQADTCAAVDGATGASYVMTADDVGKSIRARVSATNPDATVVSPTSLSSAVLSPSPKLTTAPVISGTPKAGQTLTVTQGTWAGDGTSVADAWWRCSSPCVAITGATAPTYVPTSAVVGTYVKVRETATGPGGSTSTFSANVGPVTSATSGSTTLSAGDGPTVLRSASGSPLASVAVAPARGTTFAAGTASAASRPMTVRVRPRRAVRVVACVPPSDDEAPACTSPRTLRRTASLRMPKAGVRVVVTAQPVLQPLKKAKRRASSSPAGGR